jgi:hypothetical protein
MKNWKTTTAGILAALAQIAVPLLSSGVGLTWKTVVPAVLTGAVGILAKDSNVTGGTVQQ